MTSATSPSPGFDPLRAAGAVTRLARVLDQRLRAHRSDDGLGMPELSVLGEIERGTTLPSAIARATRLDPARVTRVVDGLVSRGLVTRAPGVHDRRQLLLDLTEVGRDQLAQGRADVRETMAGLLEGLSEEERAALALALSAVQRVLAQV